MKCPVLVPMGGYKIRIEYVEKVDDEGACGEAEPTKHLIRISTTANTTAATVHSTILHELLHMAMGISGLAAMLGDKREEAMASGLEHMLAPLVRLDAPGIKYKEIEFPWENE
jgi:hypothetical protein